ncbi:ATP-binding protein [Thermococcus atlanticus]
MFIDRKEELKLLEERLNGGRAEFIVVYGRRRIGKTALLLEFLKRNGGIYLLARETSTHENLKRFSKKVASYFNDPFLAKNPFQSWDAFFEYISERSKSERLIIVIDEFPYLVKGSPELPSILQEYWDLRLKNTKIYLVICGSSISMMEKLLGYRSPIYGRRTAQMKLKPLGFFDARAFFPNYSMEELVMAYGILGGTPAYLIEFDDSKGIAENLREYFRPDSFLYGDALFVLREELEEPRNYFAIMEAIAKGSTTLGEIMNETGLERATVGKYLSVLISLGLVRREVPVTASRKSRKGHYRIRDNYFTFWFRYVYPNADMVEMGMGNELVEAVMDDLNSYLGFVFEDIVHEFLVELNRSGKLPFKFTRIGRWWRKGEEIDLVALNKRERKALFIEVKWKGLEEGEARRILKDLKRKAELVGLEGWEKSYGLVARHVEGKERLRENCLLWELSDLEVLMIEKT